MRDKIRVEITLRTILDDSLRNKRSIWLPTTRQEIEEIISEKDFKESGKLITEAFMPLYHDISFSEGSSLTEYNLLAEKLESLNSDDERLLYAILNAKNNYFTGDFAKVKPHNLCSLIDNLQNYRLHPIVEDLDFDKIMRCSTNYLEEAIEYIGTPYSFVNNYEKYKEYEMPYNNQFLRLSIQNLDKANKIETLTFPLDGDDYSFVTKLNENSQFRINNIYAEFEPYATFNVTKKELLELNDFASEYYEAFGLQQTKFKALYEYHNEMLLSVEKGITFDLYKEILDKVDDYEIWNKESFEKKLVEKYCELNNIQEETKELIDGERMFNKLFENEPIYVTNENLYVISKADLEYVFEQQKAREVETMEEQEFNGLEM